MASLMRGGSWDHTQLVDDDNWLRYCTPVCGGWQYNITSSGCYLSVDKGYWKGMNTPNFHRRLRAGELLPQTPWTKYQNVGSSTDGYSYTTTGSINNRTEYKRDPCHQYSEWVLSESLLTAKAPTNLPMFVQSAAAAMYSSGHDTLTALIEMASVYRMFKEIVPKLVNVLLKTARKKLRLTDATGLWLEGRYGWRTLIYDLNDLYEVLNNWSDHKQRLSKTCGNTFSDSVTTTWTVGTSLYYTDFVRRDSWQVGVRGNVVADIEIPKLQFNVIQTGWELLPFSFVIDWVVGVGRAISAASFRTAAQRFSASGGYKIEYTRELEVTRRKNTCLDVNFNQTGRSVAVLEVRQPMDVPILPHLSLNLDSLKVIDLIGMLIQALRGH